MPESPLARTVAAYVAAWNTTDADRREALLEAAFAADGTYADPSVRLPGRAALEAHCTRLTAQRPGVRIDLTSGIDEHPGGACFTWAVFDPAGRVLREGLDVVTLDGDGRITQVLGFFGAYRSPLVGGAS